MLPPFHIGNLQSPLEPVQIAAPCYDETLSCEPRAALMYKDDDGDSITIGSSLELEQCLGERTSLAQRRQLAELHKSLKSLTEAENRHIFSIDNDERTQDIWQRVKENSKCQTAMTARGSGIAAHTPEQACQAQTKEVSPYAVEDNTHEDRPCGPNFEDYRAHYFNATNPPQFVAEQKPLDLLRGSRALKPGVDRDDDICHLTQDVKLTLEGKTQARLAGEKFRARGLYYRPRKLSTGPADRQSYHNRWATYNCSETEKPEAVRAVLTPNAKRQAQTAGDRLRSKTNRMRHVVKAFPNRVGDIDQSSHGASKSPFPPCSAQPKETAQLGLDNQMTLLELFESELARKPRHSRNQTKGTPLVPNNLPSASLMSSGNPYAETTAFAHCNASSQTSSEDIENGIRSAVKGFELCLRGIIDTLKTVQPSKSDKEILAESSRCFQNLADKELPSEVPPLHRNNQSPAHKQEAVTEHKTVDTIAEDPQALGRASSSSTRREDVRLPRGPVEKEGEPESLQPIPYEAVSGQSQLESSKSDHYTDLAGPFYYHQPGPIHLPHNNSWMQTPSNRREAAPKGMITIEDQQSQHPKGEGEVSIKSHPQSYQYPLRGGHYDQSCSPIPATTRFPTIGQFEKSALLAAPTPPFVPSLIDLNAEEGIRSSWLPRLANEDDKSESPADVSDHVSSSSTPQIVTQLRPKTETESHEDRSLNYAFAATGGSLASNARLFHRVDAPVSQNAVRNKPPRGRETDSSPTDINQFSAHRRPHSDFFSRDGRLAWDPVIGQQRQNDTHVASNTLASSTSLPLKTPGTAPPKPPAKTFATKSGVRRSTTNIETRSARRAGHNHHRRLSSDVRSQDAKIRKCVDHLTGLGFDMERSRLRVYASVADGDLDEAIDIITEDQKGHDSWGS